MTQENNLTTVNKFEVAMLDAATTSQPVLLPSYGSGEKSMPVVLVFSQTYEKDETIAVQVESDIYEQDESGNVKTELIPLEGIMIDGKQAFESKPVVKSKGLKIPDTKQVVRSKLHSQRLFLLNVATPKTLGKR